MHSSRAIRKIVVIAASAGFLAATGLDTVATAATDPIIANPVRYTMQMGRHSRFAAFKIKLQQALTDCGVSEADVVPAGKVPTGDFGDAVRKGIQRAMECPVLRDVPRTSAARKGALTVAVWRALMGSAPLPTVEERSRAMILSFEATDFGDAPEWNLCQDGTRAKFGPSHRRRGTFQCYNDSDPCSFMTWGPRGATAGSGREIQLILWMVAKSDPDLLSRAFGQEHADMLRFLRLKGSDTEDCGGDVPLKRFICAVWVDNARRHAWERAFAMLGEQPTVRAAYDRLYTFQEFDGAKLRDFYALWERLGIIPTEVDFAFFMDRITHLGGPPTDDTEFDAKFAACLRAETASLTPNAGARRCISRLQPHKTQPDLRLARDVAYFLDGYAEGVLTPREIEAWGGYIPVSAVFNFALDDSGHYPMPGFTSIEVLGPDLPKGNVTDLTPAEWSACPAEVLSPLKRRQTR
jgi:hypothetical protein